MPKAETAELRMCTDMREANKAILREPHEMPNIESLIYSANGHKKFAKVDMPAAF